MVNLLKVHKFREFQIINFLGRQIEHWTMRIIIAVAFGDAFPVKWMANTYQEYTSTINDLFVWDFFAGKLSRILPLAFNQKRWKLRKQIEEKILDAVKTRRAQLAEGTMYFKNNAFYLF